MENALRTNDWLEERLTQLRSRYFPDVLVDNILIVKFGRKARSRFGSISSLPSVGDAHATSVITINGLFIDPAVPEFVIDATLVHEFIHYTHGFHSPRRQIYAHPHRGNVIRKEFVARGAEHLEDQQNAWVKAYYKEYLMAHLPQRRIVRRRRVQQKRRIRHLWI